MIITARILHSPPPPPGSSATNAMSVPRSSIAERRRQRQAAAVDSGTKQVHFESQAKGGPAEPLVIAIPVNDAAAHLEVVSCSYWSPDSPSFDKGSEQFRDTTISTSRQPSSCSNENSAEEGKMQCYFARPRLASRASVPPAESVLSEPDRKSNGTFDASVVVKAGKREILTSVHPLRLSFINTPKEDTNNTGHGRKWSVSLIPPQELEVASRLFEDISGELPSEDPECALTESLEPAFKGDEETDIPPATYDERDENGVACAEGILDANVDATSACDAQLMIDCSLSRPSSGDSSQSSTLVSEDGNSSEKTSWSPPEVELSSWSKPVHRVRRKPPPSVPPHLEDYARNLADQRGTQDAATVALSNLLSPQATCRASTLPFSIDAKKQRRFGMINLWNQSVLPDSQVPLPKPWTSPYPAYDSPVPSPTMNAPLPLCSSDAIPPPLQPLPTHRRHRTTSRPKRVTFADSGITDGRPSWHREVATSKLQMPHHCIEERARTSFFHHNGMRRSQSTGNFARRVLKRSVA